MDAGEPTYPCPCCGHLVFGERPGSHEICYVCFWEDDLVQLRWPNWSGGANKPSLIDAQRAYADLGAIEPRFVGMVRDATLSESVDAGWRPLDPAIDGFEPLSVHSAPWPEDRTTLYWWRATYWRRG